MWKICLFVYREMMGEYWTSGGLLCFAIIVVLDVLVVEGEVGKEKIEGYYYAFCLPSKLRIVVSEPEKPCSMTASHCAAMVAICFVLVRSVLSAS
jgi:hypothetical protein